MHLSRPHGGHYNKIHLCVCACIYLKVTPSNLSFGLSAGNISNSYIKSHIHINIMLTLLSFTEPHAKLTFTGQLQNLIIMQISS